MRATLAGCSTAPPPTATTASLSREAEVTARSSIRRKAFSPCRAKMLRMLRPAARSISASVSTKRRSSSRARRLPTVLLPLAMKPTRKTLGLARRGMVGLHLLHGVAAVLDQELVGQLQGGQGLPDDSGRGHGADVGALHVRLD